MSFRRLIPIMKVTLDSKSNQELKGCIGEDVVYHNNQPFATPQNIMKGSPCWKNPAPIIIMR